MARKAAALPVRSMQFCQALPRYASRDPSAGPTNKRPNSNWHRPIITLGLAAADLVG